MVMYDDTDLDLSFSSEDEDDTASAPSGEASDALSHLAPLVTSTNEKPRGSVSSLASICVVGGVTAAPGMAILGCIGLALPTTSALHQAASLLVCAALLWLGMALITAQGTRGTAARDTTPDSGHHV